MCLKCVHHQYKEIICTKLGYKATVSRYSAVYVIDAFQMLSDLLHSTFTQCYVYIIPLSYKFALNFVLSVDRLKEC